MRPRPPGRTRDLSGSDVLPSCVTGSSTTAERQRLAIAALPMLPSALSTTSASAMCNFRGSIAHPTRSLCTLRNRRRRRPRNTRYQAGATPYLGRSFTCWITSASPDALTVYEIAARPASVMLASQRLSVLPVLIATPAARCARQPFAREYGHDTGAIRARLRPTPRLPSRSAQALAPTVCEGCSRAQDRLTGFK